MSFCPSPTPRFPIKPAPTSQPRLCDEGCAKCGFKVKRILIALRVSYASGCLHSLSVLQPTGRGHKANIPPRAQEMRHPCGRGVAAPAGVQRRTAPLLLFAHLIFRARAEGRGSGADAALCAAASAAGSWPTQRHTGPLGTRPSTGTGGDLRQEQEGNNLRFLPGLILS